MLYVLNFNVGKLHLHTVSRKTGIYQNKERKWMLFIIINVIIWGKIRSRREVKKDKLET